MKIRNIEKQKMSLLAELEDFIIDPIVDNISKLQNSDKLISQEAQSKLIDDIAKIVKENAFEICKILLVDDNGNEATDEALAETPVKLFAMKHCLPVILKLTSEFMQGSPELSNKPTGKPIAPTRKRPTS